MLVANPGALSIFAQWFAVDSGNFAESAAVETAAVVDEVVLVAELVSLLELGLLVLSETLDSLKDLASLGLPPPS